MGSASVADSVATVLAQYKEEMTRTRAAVLKK